MSRVLHAGMSHSRKIENDNTMHGQGSQDLHTIVNNSHISWPSEIHLMASTKARIVGKLVS